MDFVFFKRMGVTSSCDDIFVSDDKGCLSLVMFWMARPRCYNAIGEGQLSAETSGVSANNRVSELMKNCSASRPCFGLAFGNAQLGGFVNGCGQSWTVQACQLSNYPTHIFQ
jgi:hypothetical protein